MKGASGRGRQRARDISRKDNPLLSCPLYNVGDGREKRLRVGMKKSVEYVDGSPHFYNSAKVHDCDAVTHVADHRKIMGDQKERKGEFSLQFLEKVDNLSLDGEVQRGNRFIGDNQTG